MSVNPLAEISEMTGGVVKVNPFLIGSDGQPVALSELVASIEKHLDLDAMLKAFPTINAEQIAGSTAFLRKICE